MVMISKRLVTPQPDRPADGSDAALPDLRLLADEELMERIKQDNHDAFAYLFDRYYRLVMSIAMKLLRDWSEAEDLMQDVFFEIYRKAENFDADRGTTKYWIMRIAYSRAISRLEYLNTRQFYQPPKLTQLYEPFVEHSESHWKGLSVEEWRDIIQQGLATLNNEQRETLELACFHGHSLKEIADIMNESIGNTRHHYYRGIKKLREYLRDRSCFEERLARSRQEAVKEITIVKL
jgi:RNA polymerase sigma-70 factor (ECF subfamily)